MQRLEKSNLTRIYCIYFGILDFFFGKNDFAEEPKILLDTDLKIILSNTAKNFDILLATSLSVSFYIII